MEALLWPGRILVLSGLLLAAVCLWTLAPLLRRVAAGFVLRASGRVRAGAVVASDGVRGRVVGLGWLQTTLTTEAGDHVLVPNDYLVGRPLWIGCDAEAIRPPEAGAAELALAPARGSLGSGAVRDGDEFAVDPDADLEALQAAHAATRIAIAELADIPPDLDPGQMQRRQAALIRRLAQIETLLCARQGPHTAAGRPGSG